MPDATGSVQSVLVTYPTGQDIAFGRNADGTFTAPSGRFATFTETRSGATLTGYTLTDKDASVYTFGQSAGGGVFRLTAVTDANGRTLTVDYTGGLASRITSASGRSLWLTWDTPTGSAHPHVTTVATDPADPGTPASAETWQYAYGPDDTLTQVCPPICPPTGPSACHGYSHTTISPYANTVLDTGPYSYWPLSESSGETVARSAVLTNAGIDNARYAAVTLGQAAARPGSTATVAAFDGASSYLQLPGDLVADGQYQTVSMWFRTTAVNGVLFGYSAAPVTAGTTPTTYVPALYVGSDGKLRGQFWQGNAAAAITTAAPVNDGDWHHVALAGAGSTQTLYLDGVAQGSLGGIIMQLPDNADNIHVGAGFIGGNWPGHQNSGVSPAAASYFSGSISDVAFHNQALPAATVAALHAAGTRTHPVLSTVTRPTGGVTAQVTYQGTTGRVATVTDENGGVWTMGTPTVAGSADVYAASVLGAKPADYWRLGEVAVTEAVNQVDGGVATYNQVTLGADGPFAGATAASFNGTNSYVELPPERVGGTDPASVSMWFKMPSGSTTGGVLYGFQTNPITSTPVVGERIPALYVGVDGKLRGKWCWCAGTNPPVTTAGTVTDGQWHHVALTLSGSSQRMYLDGELVGTLNQGGEATPVAYAYLGAGFAMGSWPSTPGAVSYFPGEIAEAAFFTSELSQAQVTAHYTASQQTAPVAVTMISGVATAIPMPVSQVAVTGPTGETLSYSYDLVNGGRPVAQTDALDNVTKFGYDVGGYSSLVYDPRGVWTQTFQDVRGNTKQSVSCQDQSANKCSSVYYTYYPDATTTTLTPDARNDLLLTVRDGRSASETDDTYRTSYGYDASGNQTTITDPLGRVTTTGYTDGTSTAAYGGGIAPAGLPTRVTTPGGAVQTVDYHANGDVAQVTDPSGKIDRFTYDGLGRTLTETELSDTFPAGLTTTYTYDAAGRVATETGPAVTNRVTGAVHTARTTYTYDDDGNVLTETVADLTGGDAPRTEQHTYNQYGQQATSTTAGGTVTTLGYDAYGRVVTETDHDGGVTTNTYDDEGNLLTTTVLGFTGDPDDPQPATDVLISAKSYDPAGRLAAETDPMGWITEYTYTDNGLIADVTRTNGSSSFVIESNEYDAAGNLVREVTDDGATVVTYAYDAAGRQTSTTVDPDGLKRTTHYGYDADDNVVTERQTDAGDLKAGAKLRVAGRGEVTVVSVETRRDQREMRDLTVAHTHTYHVLADDHPVLVHNCGDGAEDRLSAIADDIRNSTPKRQRPGTVSESVGVRPSGLLVAVHTTSGTPGPIPGGLMSALTACGHAHGGCSEVSGAAKLMGLGAVPESVTTVGIQSKRIGATSHGQVMAPCQSCSRLLSALGIKIERCAMSATVSAYIVDSPAGLSGRAARFLRTLSRRVDFERGLTGEILRREIVKIYGDSNDAIVDLLDRLQARYGGLSYASGFFQSDVIFAPSCDPGDVDEELEISYAVETGSPVGASVKIDGAVEVGLDSSGVKEFGGLDCLIECDAMFSVADALGLEGQLYLNSGTALMAIEVLRAEEGLGLEIVSEASGLHSYWLAGDSAMVYATDVWNLLNGGVPSFAKFWATGEGVRERIASLIAQVR
ncbi:YD repeat-containing protein [Micromonospora sp. Llam0]|nr:YD repeat-containing protein [Micromonospora sp. Llam0]